MAPMRALVALLLFVAGCSSGGSLEVPDAPPVTADTFYQRALQRHAAGDREGAIDDLQEVLGRNPDDIDAQELLEQIRLEAAD